MAATPSRRARRPLAFVICASLLAGLPALAAAQQPPAAPVSAPAPFTETIPGTLVRIEMVPVGNVWMSATEITWDAYDVFVFGLDQPAAAPPTAAPPMPATPVSTPDPPVHAPDTTAPATPPGDAPSDGTAPSSAAAAAAAATPPPADAVVRPTKPHMVTDRGFGHAGYPAISMSCKGAQAFCTWLSGVTGRRYRLATEAEWESACRAGSSGAWSCGDDAAGLDAISWYRGNAEHKTHPVGSKASNALGLFDMHGNVAEWCVAPDGSGLVRGGSFRDPSKDLRCDARVLPVPAWNQSDPNLPKSVWWLADASFVGFRVVCEDAPQR